MRKFPRWAGWCRCHTWHSVSNSVTDLFVGYMKNDTFRIDQSDLFHSGYWCRTISANRAKHTRKQIARWTQQNPDNKLASRFVETLMHELLSRKQNTSNIITCLEQTQSISKAWYININSVALQKRDLNCRIVYSVNVIEIINKFESEANKKSTSQKYRQRLLTLPGYKGGYNAYWVAPILFKSQSHVNWLYLLRY